MTTNETLITVTEAARNFADCVNRAIYQNQSFLLTKNGHPVARLIPARPTSCTAKELAAAIEAVQLTDQEAKAWGEDLKAGRKFPQKPTNQWR